MPHRPGHIEDELEFRQGAGAISEQILRPRGRAATGISSERFGVNVRPQDEPLTPMVQAPGGRRFEQQALAKQPFPFQEGIGVEAAPQRSALEAPGVGQGQLPDVDPREIELRSPLRPAPTIQGAEPPSLDIRDIDLRTFGGLGQGFNRLARFASDVQAFNRDRGVSPGLGGTTPNVAGDIALRAPGLNTKNLLEEEKNLAREARDLSPDDPRLTEISKRQSEITEGLRSAQMARRESNLKKTKRFRNASPTQRNKMLAELRGKIR